LSLDVQLQSLSHVVEAEQLPRSETWKSAFIGFFSLKKTDSLQRDRSDNQW
jgi:hypothetical protein